MKHFIVTSINSKVSIQGYLIQVKKLKGADSHRILIGLVSEVESRALHTETGKTVSLSSKSEKPTNSTETLGGFLMLTGESPSFGN